MITNSPVFPEMERIGVLLMKWDTLANDDRWNGHISSTYAACAKDLREALGTKPDATVSDEGFDKFEASLQPGERGRT